MRYVLQPQPMPVYQPALGQVDAPIATSSWVILGAIGLGFFFWATSERKQSKDF